MYYLCLMKLLGILCFVSVVGFGQTNVVSYQYRFSIKDVTSNGSAKLVQDPLTDLFKTTPIYQEGLNTFIFESKEDVKKEELISLLPYSYNNITYFKKNEIKFDTLK